MSLQQFAIDFTQKLPPEVQVKISEGMQAAEDHADKFWMAVFRDCINQAALKKAEISVDDVIDELDVVNELRKQRGLEIVTTHHMCAIGPAMSRAYKDGVISPTDRVIRSKRQVKHGNRHSVWISNHYKRNR